MSRLFRKLPGTQIRTGKHAAKCSLAIQILGWLPPLRYRTPDGVMADYYQVHGA